MPHQRKNNKFAGLCGGILLNLFSRKKHKISSLDLKKNEFKTDSKAIGVNFNDKIRRVFRPNWLKKSTDTK